MMQSRTILKLLNRQPGAPLASERLPDNWSLCQCVGLAGKQIVLSSDSPPKDIPTLQERLVSRFKWGLVTELEMPCYETRVAILKRKSRQRLINAPPRFAKIHLSGHRHFGDGSATIDAQMVETILARRERKRAEAHKTLVKKTQNVFVYLFFVITFFHV